MQKSLIPFFIAIGLCLSSICHASPFTYFTRDGGGTSTQCTGLVNAVYPGSGSAQPCAFSHPAYPMGAGYDTGTHTAAIWTHSDTLNIVGDSDITKDFTASNVIVAPAVGDHYTNNGFTWTITVVNLSGVTSGSGTISASASVGQSPTSSGTLIRSSGSGDASISFSATAVSQAQFMIGYGMPNTLGCSTSWAYQCNLYNMPPGTTSSQPTKLIGVGNHQPQLWGTQADERLLNTAPLSPASSGTLTVLTGSGTSPISYSAANGNGYTFQVTGVSVPPAIGDQYTNNGNTYVVKSLNLTGGTGEIYTATSSFPGVPQNFTGNLTVVPGHGSGTSPIAWYPQPTYATYVFTVSGASTPPSVGDEYTTGGQVYNVVSVNISGGNGTIQVNSEANVDIENIEWTSHNSCSAVLTSGSSPAGYNGFPGACPYYSSTYPVGDWVRHAWYLTGTNITTANNWIHNIAVSSVVVNNNVSNWNSTADKVVAAGEFLTDGNTMTYAGNNSLTNDIWAWGGCMEKYPLPDPANVRNVTNYINCADQNYSIVYGGFALGGGFMMQSQNIGACGNWTVTGTQLLFNLKTNWDWLHCDATGTLNFYRSRSEGSSGEALKLNVHTVNIEESQMIADAPIWTTTPFLNIFTNNSSALLCRGNGSAIVLTQSSGMSVNVLNSDMLAGCQNDIGVGNSYGLACGGATVTWKNSKLVNGYDWYDNDGAQANYYYDFSGCNLTYTEDHNISYNGHAFGGIGCSGTGDLCQDPKIVGQTNLGAVTTWLGSSSATYYSGTDLGDQLYLQSISPMIGAGVGGLTYTNGTSNDYNNHSANSPITMGALQNNTCIPNSTGNTVGMCSISNQCCGGNCNTEGFCAGTCTANGGSCSSGSTCCSNYCSGSICSNPPAPTGNKIITGSCQISGNGNWQ